MAGDYAEYESSDPVQQAWLRRRREMVATASKRIRQKKKQEREDLEEQNASLRQEREKLLEQIASLQSQVGGPAIAAAAAAPAHIEQENATLKQELASHKAFLSSVFTQLPAVDPSSSPKMAELSRQNHDSNMLHFMRLLAHSQQNSKREWRMLNVGDGDLLFSKPTRVLVRYMEAADGAYHLRFDIIVHASDVTPKAVAGSLVRTWEDYEYFSKLFGEGVLTTLKELVDFRVQRDRETLSAFYRRGPLLDASEAPYLYKEMVYFTSKGSCTLNKSSLDVGVAVPVDLPLTIPAAEVLPAAWSSTKRLLTSSSSRQPPAHEYQCRTLCSSSSSSASQIVTTTTTTTTTTTRKRQRHTPLVPKAVDPVLFGLAECHFGMRSITEHGTVEEEDTAKDTYRVSSGLTEGIFAWRDEDEGKTCAAWMMTLPKGLATKFCLADQLSEHQAIGPRMAMFMGRFIEGFLAYDDI